MMLAVLFALVDKLRQLKPTRIVLEATGGFEAVVAAGLTGATGQEIRPLRAGKGEKT